MREWLVVVFLGLLDVTKLQCFKSVSLLCMLHLVFVMMIMGRRLNCINKLGDHQALKCCQKH